MKTEKWKITDGDYKSEKEEYIKKFKHSNLKRFIITSVKFVLTLVTVIFITYFISCPD